MHCINCFRCKYQCPFLICVKRQSASSEMQPRDCFPSTCVKTVRVCISEGTLLLFLCDENLWVLICFPVCLVLLTRTCWEEAAEMLIQAGEVRFHSLHNAVVVFFLFAEWTLLLCQLLTASAMCHNRDILFPVQTDHTRTTQDIVQFFFLSRIETGEWKSFLLDGNEALARILAKTSKCEYRSQFIRY